MRFISLSFLLAALCLGASLRADAGNLSYALGQLPGNGPASFAKILLPRQPDAAKRLAANLDKASTDVGPLLDHQIIASARISSRLERFVIALHYEARPIFLRLDRYVSANEERFLNATVLTNVDELLPDAELLPRD